MPTNDQPKESFIFPSNSGISKTPISSRPLFSNFFNKTNNAANIDNSLNSNGKINQIQSLSNKQGVKRPMTTQNDNTSNYYNKNQKITHSITSQKTLKNFNSHDPESNQTEIDLTKNSTNDGFTMVGDKQKHKLQKRNLNKQYVNSIGRGESSELTAYERQFYIYFGHLSMNENTETINNYLKKKLGPNKFKNLKELNSDSNERSYKSFVFSVGFLDKDIIKNKELWPLYTVVNKFHMPYAEWLIISEKFKKKTNFPSTTIASSINNSANIVNSINN